MEEEKFEPFPANVKVKEMLETCSFPDYHDPKVRSNWKQRLLRPMIKNLNALKEAGIVKDWRFTPFGAEASFDTWIEATISTGTDEEINQGTIDETVNYMTAPYKPKRKFFTIPETKLLLGISQAVTLVCFPEYTKPGRTTEREVRANEVTVIVPEKEKVRAFAPMMEKVFLEALKQFNENADREGPLDTRVSIRYRKLNRKCGLDASDEGISESPRIFKIILDTLSKIEFTWNETIDGKEQHFEKMKLFQKPKVSDTGVEFEFTEEAVDYLLTLPDMAVSEDLFAVPDMLPAQDSFSMAAGVYYYAATHEHNGALMPTVSEMLAFTVLPDPERDAEALGATQEELFEHVKNCFEIDMSTLAHFGIIGKPDANA